MAEVWVVQMKGTASRMGVGKKKEVWSIKMEGRNALRSKQ